MSYGSGGGGGGATIGGGTGTVDTLAKLTTTTEVDDATGVTQATGKTLVVTSQAAADEPLTLKGAASQSGNMLEVTTSADVLKSYIPADGNGMAFVNTASAHTGNIYAASFNGLWLGSTDNQVVIGNSGFSPSTQNAIFNTTGSGTTETLKIVSQAVGKPGINIALAASQTGDALQVTSSGGSAGDLFKVSATGWVTGTGRSRVAANVTNTTITPAAITGLSSTVIAGRTYAGKIILHYNQATAADGFRFDLDGGTATATDLRLGGTISDSTSTRYLGMTTALATDLTDTSTSGNALVTIEFTITVNVAGTIIPRFAKEADAAGATATVYRGSWMELVDIP